MWLELPVLCSVEKSTCTFGGPQQREIPHSKMETVKWMKSHRVQVKGEETSPEDGPVEHSFIKGLRSQRKLLRRLRSDPLKCSDTFGAPLWQQP